MSKLKRYDIYMNEDETGCCEVESVDGGYVRYDDIDHSQEGFLFMWVDKPNNELERSELLEVIQHQNTRLNELAKDKKHYLNLRA